MLDIAIEAAREAGRILMERLNEPREIRIKGKRDIVTDADLAAQEAIIRIIKSHYPEHDILSEEATQKLEGHSDHCWIIDPLDGTTNYSRRYPCFSVSIAVSFQGAVILGVAYDPLRDQLFKAQCGEGAYLNGKRIGVSERKSCGQALIGLDWAHRSRERAEVIQLVQAIAPLARTLRTCGSAVLGLCYVASGWLDAYFNTALKPWDGAAGSLIIREAGGKITDLAGHPWQLDSPQCLASNGLIHKQLLSILGNRR